MLAGSRRQASHKREWQNSRGADPLSFSSNPVRPEFQRLRCEPMSTQKNFAAGAPQLIPAKAQTYSAIPQVTCRPSPLNPTRSISRARASGVPGSYIEMEPGSGQPSHEFVALEDPPGTMEVTPPLRSL